MNAELILKILLWGIIIFLIVGTYIDAKNKR